MDTVTQELLPLLSFSVGRTFMNWRELNVGDLTTMTPLDNII